MTAQFPERLILDGEEVSMTFCPPLPEAHPRVVPFDEDSQPMPLTRCTGCWRGYVATWEIRDGRFYLRRIWGRFQVLGDEPILADWFSGVLRVPRGKRLLYVHMGFGSVYEEDLLIRVERGVVTNQRVMDNRGRELDERTIGLANLPGFENHFPGKDEV